MIRAWFDTVDYIAKQPDEAVKIMAKVVSLPPADYKVFLPGTRFFDAAANKAAFDANNPLSLTAVAPTINGFLTQHKLVEGKPEVARGLDGSLLAEALNVKP